MRELTPYDTGQRCEPKPWTPVRKDTETYGRVDFENDESATVLTLYVESTPDGYRVIIDPFVDAEDISVEING